MKLHTSEDACFINEQHNKKSLVRGCFYCSADPSLSTSLITAEPFWGINAPTVIYHDNPSLICVCKLLNCVFSSRSTLPDSKKTKKEEASAELGLTGPVLLSFFNCIDTSYSNKELNHESDSQD